MAGKVKKIIIIVIVGIMISALMMSYSDVIGLDNAMLGIIAVVATVGSVIYRVFKPKPRTSSKQ
ncbi:hypothetical protein [Nitrosopumilus sp.]|uniref:hypothetical protein n=1 Tax=Nitrosopumilus sp. TaxID=2024843 RepID=UPI003D13AE82